MNSSPRPRHRQRGRIPMWLVGIVGGIVALAGVEFYAKGPGSQPDRIGVGLRP